MSKRLRQQRARACDCGRRRRCKTRRPTCKRAADGGRKSRRTKAATLSHERDAFAAATTANVTHTRSRARARVRWRIFLVSRGQRARAFQLAGVSVCRREPTPLRDFDRATPAGTDGFHRGTRRLRRSPPPRKRARRRRHGKPHKNFRLSLRVYKWLTRFEFCATSVCETFVSSRRKSNTSASFSTHQAAALIATIFNTPTCK